MRRFIALEGIDGSGKTTLARGLADAHKRMGIPHTLTREPGGTTLGQHARRLLLDPRHDPTPTTELLLYAADRAQHVENLIKPALARGHTVITDRYTASTIAYQHYARGLPLATIIELNRLATGGLKPDLTVLLDLEPEDAHRRTKSRAKDRLEIETITELTFVRHGYLQQAEVDNTWLVLDALTDIDTLVMHVMEHLCMPAVA